MLKILFFGGLAEICGRELQISLPENIHTVYELRDLMCTRFPSAAAIFRHDRSKVCVDLEIIHADVALRPEQEIAFMPPLSGG